MGVPRGLTTVFSTLQRNGAGRIRTCDLRTSSPTLLPLSHSTCYSTATHQLASELSLSFEQVFPSHLSATPLVRVASAYFASVSPLGNLGNPET